MNKIENALELICAAINDCDAKGMKHTSDTLRAALADLERSTLEGLKIDLDICPIGTDFVNNDNEFTWYKVYSEKELQLIIEAYPDVDEDSITPVSYPELICIEDNGSDKYGYTLESLKEVTNRFWHNFDKRVVYENRYESRFVFKAEGFSEGIVYALTASDADKMVRDYYRDKVGYHVDNKDKFIVHILPLKENNDKLTIIGPF